MVKKAFCPYQSEYFTVSMAQTSEQLVLDVTVPTHLVTTKNMTHTVSYLENKIPSVLQTRCYNPDNLTFKEEVENTEIAHLLEHILLDLFCEEKMKRGAETAYCKGETSWDWNVNKIGTFTIVLNIPKEDQHVIQLVLPRALELMEALVDREGGQHLLPA